VPTSAWDSSRIHREGWLPYAAPAVPRRRRVPEAKRDRLLISAPKEP
jgi:hypothetical protein